VHGVISGKKSFGSLEKVKRYADYNLISKRFNESSIGSSGPLMVSSEM
jgi:hypothetical protein